jgi:hypothetical protein
VKFKEFLMKVRQNDRRWQVPSRLLALDPGETTGWALFVEGELKDAGQIVARHNPAQALVELFNKTNPTDVVAEDYKVYSWKIRDHSWSNLFTPKLIGALQMLCAQRRIPLTMQMAQSAKGFCTNDKLYMWGLHKHGKRHADDAIRHAVYFLLFGKGTKHATKGLPES